MSQLLTIDSKLELKCLIATVISGYYRLVAVTWHYINIYSKQMFFFPFLYLKVSKPLPLLSI